MKFGSRILSYFFVLICLSQRAFASEDLEGARGCIRLNENATSSFDFTKNIFRWGSKDLSSGLENGEYVVRTIAINKLPIFDESNPDENNAIYRWANRFHVTTKDQVLRDQLLFGIGDKVDAQLLAESERITRDNKYVSDSTIRVLRKCGNSVDLELVTREVWTLSPEVSFKTAGGDSAVKVGLRDTNFLGSGHQLAAFYKNNIDRNSYSVRYKDPNLLSKRIVLKTQATKSTDGHEYLGLLQLPFYALNSKRAWVVEYREKEVVAYQYSFGEKVSQVDVDAKTAKLSLGVSSGLKNGYVRRWSMGLKLNERRYKQGTELPLPDLLSPEKDLIYPFIKYQVIEDNYAVGYNINQIYRIEDLHVGSNFGVDIGYNSNNFTGFIVEGFYSNTLVYLPKNLLQLSVNWHGELIQSGKQWLDSYVNMNLKYHHGISAYRSLYVGFKASISKNLADGTRIELGGSNGLRGYKNHYLNGDESYLMTIEERIFTKYHIFNLARVGFAAFFDIGKVVGNLGSEAVGGTYADIGFGLRLALSKSEKGQVIHVDLAYPLNNGPFDNNRSIQIVAELKRSL